MDPVAFHFGGLTVHWYGVMVALGFAAGLWTAARRSRLGGLTPEQVLDVGPWIIVGAIIGARFLYVISYWDQQFAGKPFWEVFMVHHGGLVYYGGLIGACLSTILYTRLKKIRLWQLADVMAPSIALGSMFGRIGCLLNGCCYGSSCSLPWAMQYPPGHESYPAHVHPTQAYDSLLNLVLYIALEWWFRRKKFDGQVFAFYLLGYAVFRSIAEMFRGDYPKEYLTGWLTPAHVISLGILVVGLVLYYLLPRKGGAPSSQA